MNLKYTIMNEINNLLKDWNETTFTQISEKIESVRDMSDLILETQINAARFLGPEPTVDKKYKSRYDSILQKLWSQCRMDPGGIIVWTANEDPLRVLHDIRIEVECYSKADMSSVL
jgi:hypothetical protein